MSRLFVHVEGETEETFVNEALAPHLYNFGYQKVSARLLGNSRNRDRRGGIRSWSSVREDIINHLKEDAKCLATTMVDYYALPKDGQRAWPGRADAVQRAFPDKSLTVQAALLADVCAELGDGFDPQRFVPYVMMHEFEGLLFSDCTRFADAIGRPELAGQFQGIRNAFSSPEEINDSPLTAPSKRVEALVAGYEKPLLGALAVLGIGLETIRRECPHFRAWIEQLEQWVQ
jgi:hypothetical protein